MVAFGWEPYSDARLGIQRSEGYRKHVWDHDLSEVWAVRKGRLLLPVGTSAASSSAGTSDQTFEEAGGDRWEDQADHGGKQPAVLTTIDLRGNENGGKMMKDDSTKPKPAPKRNNRTTMDLYQTTCKHLMKTTQNQKPQWTIKKVVIVASQNTSPLRFRRQQM